MSLLKFKIVTVTLNFLPNFSHMKRKWTRRTAASVLSTTQDYNQRKIWKIKFSTSKSKSSKKKTYLVILRS